MLELVSVYMLTKYPLPVSVTNSALPCLATPSFVYPFIPPITIHHSYCTTCWQPAKPLMPRSVLPRIPNDPLFTPGQPGLRSEGSYPDAKLLHQDPFQKPNAKHAEHRHPHENQRPNAPIANIHLASISRSRSLSPEGSVAPSPNGAITSLTASL